MSKTLLESDFLTVDLRTIYNSTSNTAAAEDATEAGDHAEPNTPTQKPATSTSEITDETLEKLLVVDKKIDAAIAKQIIAFGEPFKKAIKVLGTKTTPGNGSNPILAFVTQKYVQNSLIATGLLNASTFKAIYNAVSKRLVADSEFFKHVPQNDYNIIYCRDLYTKSPSEMIKYLTLQSRILTLGASEYKEAVRTLNKKVFINIDLKDTAGHKINELEPSKRAKLVIASTGAKAVTAKNAKLNSITLAELISNKPTTNTTELSTKGQDSIVNELKKLGVAIKTAVYAVLLTLSMNSDSKKAKEAIASSYFTTIDSAETITAIKKLAANNIIPKGKISTTDADALVTKLLSAINNT
jgi:hypothetical protein